MIIIIASEVPNVARAVAGEAVNLYTGYEYYNNGVLIDHGDKPAPAYPVYVSKNKVYTIRSPTITVYDSRTEVLGLGDLRPLITEFITAIGQYWVPSRVSFATVKSRPGTTSVPQMLTNTSASSLLSDYTLYSDTCAAALSSIVIVSTPGCITAAHRTVIPRITQDMLPVYNGSIHCNKLFNILATPFVNVLSIMLSDFWHTYDITRSSIMALEYIPIQINDDMSDYLHPVEYYPPGSDEPEFRTDLCSMCKSRLFDENYALYNQGANLVAPVPTLCAICPLCVHCTGIAQHCRGTWYTFTHPRRASDLIGNVLERLPEDMHPVARAICGGGLNLGSLQVRDGEKTYTLHSSDVLDKWDIIGDTLVYGKKIKIIVPKQ